MRGTPSKCRAPVLIVEDDDDIRESLADLLRLDGHPIATATNGLEALEHLLLQGPPCMILLDLMMPVMDGSEFLARMRRDGRFGGVPVVVMTAVRHFVPTAPEVTDYFVKPLDLDVLLGAIEKYC